MMSAIELYEAPHSPDCFAVALFCYKSNLHFNRNSLSLLTGKFSTPDHPQIPYIQDGTHVIQGRHTILRYLACKYHYRGHWYPEDVILRSQIDEILETIQKLDMHLKQYTFQEALLLCCGSPEFPCDLRSNTVLMTARSNTERLIKKLDACIASDGFLFGKEPTIADVSLICTLLRLNLVVHFEVLALPRIPGWAQNMASTFAPYFYEVAGGYGCREGNPLNVGCHPLLGKKLSENEDQKVEKNWDKFMDRKLDELLNIIEQAKRWGDEAELDELQCRSQVRSNSDRSWSFSL